MTDQEIARALLEFYGGEETRWTTVHYAKDTKGRPTEPYDPEATCWCLLGASKALDIRFGAVIPILQPYLGNQSVSEFNDSHSFSEIQTLLREIAGLA